MGGVEKGREGGGRRVRVEEEGHGEEGGGEGGVEMGSGKGGVRKEWAG